jgi:hypothetical protein
VRWNDIPLINEKIFMFFFSVSSYHVFSLSIKPFHVALIGDLTQWSSSCSFISDYCNLKKYLDILDFIKNNLILLFVKNKKLKDQN